MQQRKPTGAPAGSPPPADDNAKALRARKRGVPLLVQLFLLGAAAGTAAFAYWLSPALLKAWKGTRARDYESEKTFDDGSG